MSKLSRFLIGVIVVGLAFIASLHLYRTYEKYAESSEEEAAPTMTFNNVPVHYVPPVVDEPVFQRWPEEPKQQQEVYLQDTPLDAQTEQEQARQTIQSILEDYEQDPQLQAFYRDLQRATGQQIDLSMLSGEQLSSLLTAYPQLSQVISDYAKDPAFAQTLQAIFSNPQFARSVAVLQQKQTEEQRK